LFLGGEGGGGTVCGAAHCERAAPSCSSSICNIRLISVD
jgi:hypothetical protein